MTKKRASIQTSPKRARKQTTAAKRTPSNSQKAQKHAERFFKMLHLEAKDWESLADKSGDVGDTLSWNCVGVSPDKITGNERLVVGVRYEADYDSYIIHTYTLWAGSERGGLTNFNTKRLPGTHARHGMQHGVKRNKAQAALASALRKVGSEDYKLAAEYVMGGRGQMIDYEKSKSEASTDFSMSSLSGVEPKAEEALFGKPSPEKLAKKSSSYDRKLENLRTRLEAIKAKKQRRLEKFKFHRNRFLQRADQLEEKAEKYRHKASKTRNPKKRERFQAEADKYEQATQGMKVKGHTMQNMMKGYGEQYDKQIHTLENKIKKFTHKKERVERKRSKIGASTKETAAKNPIQYKGRLNSKIFNSEGTLHPDVKEALEKVAKAYIKFVYLKHLKVRDLVLKGSSANFNYSSFSDIDLNLVVTNELSDQDVRTISDRNQLWKQKYGKIRVKGIEVEPGILPVSKKVASAGMFSVRHNQWISKPEYNKPKYSKSKVNKIFKAWARDIEKAIKSGDPRAVGQVYNIIAKERDDALHEPNGKKEFSEVNLAFKKLRAAGVIDKLKAFREMKQVEDLSLKSQPVRDLLRALKNAFGKKGEVPGPVMEKPVYSPVKEEPVMEPATASALEIAASEHSPWENEKILTIELAKSKKGMVDVIVKGLKKSDVLSNPVTDGPGVQMKCSTDPKHRRAIKKGIAAILVRTTGMHPVVFGVTSKGEKGSSNLFLIGNKDSGFAAIKAIFNPEGVYLTQVTSKEIMAKAKSIAEKRSAKAKKTASIKTSANLETAAKMKKYWALYVKQDGHWGSAFGDFDRETVTQERSDSYTKDDGVTDWVIIGFECPTGRAPKEAEIQATLADIKAGKISTKKKKVS